MATVVTSRKACTVNPLKMSQPIGAALAFMGLNHCMPVLHGSQGCTAFGLVLFVRHFREAIPLQTTAMNEVTTIMGGIDNIEEAILNIQTRAKPQVIGIASTGLTETKGDDVNGYLTLIRRKHPQLDTLPVVFVSTPDYTGAFQDGWSKAVTRIIETLVPATSAQNADAHLNTVPPQMAGTTERRPLLAVLAGSHLTPGDIDALREIIASFALESVFLPDLSSSLDGHIPDDFTPTTLGGTNITDLSRLGTAIATLALGEQMRAAATALSARTGVPFTLLDRLTGLEANDALFTFLSRISGKPVPEKYRRQRSQLVDGMLDAHFFFGGKKVAIGAEPDLLWNLSTWLVEMGAQISVAVTTTHSSVLEQLPVAEVIIGDLEDLERRAAGCDLLITHSHGRQMAERLGIAFLRMGLPIFDRLGSAHRVSVGYRGTCDLLFEVGNFFIAHEHDVGPQTWLRTTSVDANAVATAIV